MLKVTLKYPDGNVIYHNIIDVNVIVDGDPITHAYAVLKQRAGEHVPSNGGKLYPHIYRKPLSIDIAPDEED